MSDFTPAGATVHLSTDGTAVNHWEYAPNGQDHELQRRITDLLHRIVEEDGRFTLAELGYLHMNSLTYSQETGNLDLRIYFDAHLAARPVQSRISANRTVAPVKELEVFENHLFVGDMLSAITFDRVLAPKSKVDGDEVNRASLRFKDDAKPVETDVLVLHCNLGVTMAAIHNVSLMDPAFSVRCSTVGKSAKKLEKAVVMSVSGKEVPVAVTVEASADGGEFNPDDAEAYVAALFDRAGTVAANRKKLAEKAQDKAKKAKKKTGHSAAYLKYS